MYCPKCAADNPDDARFCGTCGVTMPRAPEPVPPHPPGPHGGATVIAVQPPASPVSSQLKWGVFWTAVFIPFSFVALIMGIMYVADDNPGRKVVGKFWLKSVLVSYICWCVLYGMALSV